jgi:outer membrane protein assembly factor BamD (BamD/ComL family)
VKHSLLATFLFLAALIPAGCTGTNNGPRDLLTAGAEMSPFRLVGWFGDDESNNANAPAQETFTLGADGLVSDKPSAAIPAGVAARLAEARDLYRRDEFDRAHSIFARIADNDKNPPAAVQEAMYYRAECLRKTGHYPKAADVYAALLNKFPNTAYREQCVQQMYTIANYWLDDTRDQMKEAKEQADGKRWFVWPRFLSFEKSKPLLDREGRAIEKLEQVRLHDINGPLADQALFLCGVVKMYNGDYREADHYFSQIHARHPESELAPKAIELAIFSKHMSTGGSDYDGRKTAEARKLVQAALRSYPQLANDKEKRAFLERQLHSIDLQQAEKDYKMAEFYRRTGHPASAYFYYELVRRRYPDTKYARLAEQRWNELRAEVQRTQGGAPAPVSAPYRPAPATSPLPPGGQQ